MRETIQQLVEELSQFTANVPADFKVLKAIFAKHPIPKEAIPEPIKPIINHLIELERLVDQGVAASFNQFKLEELKQKISKATEEVQTLSSQLVTLNESIATKKNAVDVLYKQFSQHSDRNDATEISIQKQFIDDLINCTKNHLKRVSTTQAQYEVALLEEQMNTLVNELKTLNVVTSQTYSDHRFDNLLLYIQQEQTELEQLKIRVSTLCNKSAHHLLLKDLQDTIAEANKNCAEVVREQTLLTKLLENCKLDVSGKTRLTQEFNSAINKETLIESYKNKINGVESYFDLNAWSNYLSKPVEYNQNQAIFKLELQFVELLLKGDLLAAEKAEYEHSLALLTPLINNQVSETDAQSFITEAAQLFKNDLLRAPDTNNPTGPDYYLCLNKNIPLIDKQINQKKDALGKLQKLVELNKQLLAICTEHDFILSGYEEKLSLDDLKIAADKELIANAAAKKELTEGLAVYERFQAQIAEVEQLIKRAEQCDMSVKTMQSQVQNNQDIIKDLEKNTTETTSQLQVNISNKLKLAKQLLTAVAAPTPSVASVPTAPSVPTAASDPRLKASLPVLPASPAPAVTTTPQPVAGANMLAPIPVRSPGLTVAHPLSTPAPHVAMLPPKKNTIPKERQKMQRWHDEILSLMHHDLELKQWYTKVYQALALDTLPLTTSVCRQANVLRDILFELQHKKGDKTVINAYMRLCNDPQKDINKLLQLKPNFFAWEHTQPINTPEFQNLHTQYHHLRANYPIEAELLRQGIQLLEMAKNDVCSTIPNEQTKEPFPSLLDDPRYGSIKRHRGALKLLEYLEDLLKWCIGKFNNQPEYTYTNTACFFNTRSATLIEQADQNIRTDLARPVNR